MSALLTGLWIFCLVVGLLHRPRPQIVVLPVLVLPPGVPAAPPEEADEAWLRRQLAGLGGAAP